MLIELVKRFLKPDFKKIFLFILLSIPSLLVNFTSDVEGSRGFPLTYYIPPHAEIREVGRHNGLIEVMHADRFTPLFILPSLIIDLVILYSVSCVIVALSKKLFGKLSR